ncbi:DNA-binding transcriptional regulator [Vibrio aerogenes CECT 7868]|uniref:DNA-binding transcriptional regulator n=2 Tax=Vibrio aerogenes TaxID=92172 RepID=A0A1M5ZY44_9VIBR|nr:DNA-binding transcriptional regulator [Vibrio aerogenes CECT 7868]
MMRCPICNKSAHTRTSRYLTKTTKESYYQCQNILCSCTFKTIESLDKIICSPLNEAENKEACHV